MTIFAEHRTADLWLKWNLIVLAAMVADDLKPRWCILTQRGLFRAAFRTSLRRHHVPLIKHFLIFFGENKDLSALNTRDFYIRHNVYLLIRGIDGYAD